MRACILLFALLCAPAVAYRPPAFARASSVPRRAQPLLSESARALEPDGKGELLAAAGSSEAAPVAGASVSSTTINLAKNIVGSGVLALAAGVASFSASRSAILPATVLLLIMCARERGRERI